MPLMLSYKYISKLVLISLIQQASYCTIYHVVLTTSDLEQVKSVSMKHIVQHNALYSVKKKSYYFPLQMRLYDGEIKLNGDVIP